MFFGGSCFKVFGVVTSGGETQRMSRQKLAWPKDSATGCWLLSENIRVTARKSSRLSGFGMALRIQAGINPMRM